MSGLFFLRSAKWRGRRREKSGRTKESADSTSNLPPCFLSPRYSKLFLAYSVGLLINNETLGTKLDWNTKVKDVIPEWKLWDETASEQADFTDLLVRSLLLLSRLLHFREPMLILVWLSLNAESSNRNASTRLLWPGEEGRDSRDAEFFASALVDSLPDPQPSFGLAFVKQISTMRYLRPSAEFRSTLQYNNLMVGPRQPDLAATSRSGFC